MGVEREASEYIPIGTLAWTIGPCFLFYSPEVGCVHYWKVLVEMSVPIWKTVQIQVRRDPSLIPWLLPDPFQFLSLNFIGKQRLQSLLFVGEGVQGSLLMVLRGSYAMPRIRSGLAAYRQAPLLPYYLSGPISFIRATWAGFLAQL